MKAADFFQTKPTLDEYRTLSPELPEEECRLQVELLPEQYFRLYPKDKLARNAGLLASLGRRETNGRQAPYRYLIETDDEGEVEVTVITFDTKALFSLVTGALSAGGMDIQAGDIFSYREWKTPQASNSRKLSPPAAFRQRRRRLPDGSESKRKVVDVFRGRSGDESGGGKPSPAAFRQELEKVLEEVLGSLFRDWDSAAPGSRAQMASGAVSAAGISTAGGPPGTGVEKAKEKVAELLSRRLLSRREQFAVPQMFPIELDVGSVSNPADEEEATSLNIRSQDTPFFLYTIGTVLSVHGISIEHVEIHTTNRAIEDTFHVRTAGGRPVTDEKLLRSLKLSILFTKQFTYFLWNAPDPYRALLRFETLLGDLRRIADEETVRSLIADSNVLRRLSRLLGTSDFIWEDFIRLQYENIIPLLAGSQVTGGPKMDHEVLERELTGRLEGIREFEERKRVLNEFKDWYTYLADLEHIIGPGADLQLLNERLTDIAELVVREAFRIAWDHLTGTHGVPQTVADLPAAYAVFGLGKFGGRALGYASDIELMTLYRDAGETRGPKQVSNAEFFSSLVQTASLIIESKQEGIYRVDLRLRPHGSGGPLAVRLNQFVSYYRDEASSLEKLSLVRMRAVAGDPEFGAQVERLRDTILYEGGGVDVDELVHLRKIQAEKYDSGEYPNVKYGPGGLVALEYCVQTLQVMDGGKTAELRTPDMSAVFSRLMELGTLDRKTTGDLERNYLFLRHLLNALRMLRGNALDLYLPRRGTPEFFHLARRMGYREKNGITAEEQLWIDFQKNTAMVRNFVEHQLGTRAVILKGPGTIADLLLADRADPEHIDALFAQAGFAKPKRAFTNFISLSGRWEEKTRFIELALFAWDELQQSPDPDMALNNWERFAAVHPDPAVHFDEAHLQPKRLEILLRIFAASQYMADLLIRYPQFFSVVTDPKKIMVPMEYEEFYRNLSVLRENCRGGGEEAWKRELRLFRHLNVLRIGSRDICYGVPLQEVLRELSALAEAAAQCALEYRLEQEKISSRSVCVLAFGKLGGVELNYSSDIDLVVLFEAAGDAGDDRGDDATGGDAGDDRGGGADVPQRKLRRLVRDMRSDLADVTENGFVYRVDFRLRPYGSSGDLVFTPAQMEEYYRRAAELWEFQALLKARPVAGNREMGEHLLRSLHNANLDRLSPLEIVKSVSAARSVRFSRSSRLEAVPAALNVKEGEGGLRDIEFLVQALQLIHARENTELICGNTLEVVRRLRNAGILKKRGAEVLTRDYIFLRRVEHFLQLLEDRQEHTLPSDPSELDALGGRMRWTRVCTGAFGPRLREVMTEVHGLFQTILSEERAQAT